MTRKTILIVDDDPMTLQLTTQLIERLGWAALIAESGEDSLALLGEREQEVDLVWLDLAMPHMNGFAVAAEIRSDPKSKDIPILALTARVEYQARTRAYASGIDGIVHKPFEVEKLHRVLQEYLDPSTPGKEAP